MSIFENRKAAGNLLALRLKKYQGDRETIVLGLPRGGVIVAAAVAKELRLPLDVLCAMKIGSPLNPEYAIGAVTAEGDPVLNPLERVADELIEETRRRAKEREELFRERRAPFQVTDKQVIVIDDGMATGLTMQAAARALRKARAKRIVIAVPVSSQEAINHMKKIADEVIALEIPTEFYAVGQFYHEFNQTTTEEVINELHSAAHSN